MLVYYFVPFIVSNRYLLFWVSSGHNSVTVQNRTHVYMNFFDHKDLGNHLLQLRPKVVKHPVYPDVTPTCPPMKNIACAPDPIITHSRNHRRSIWDFIWKRVSEFATYWRGVAVCLACKMWGAGAKNVRFQMSVFSDLPYPQLWGWLYTNQSAFLASWHNCKNFGHGASRVLHPQHALPPLSIFCES